MATRVKSNYAIKLDKDLETIHTVESGDEIIIEAVNAYEIGRAHV